MTSGAGKPTAAGGLWLARAGALLSMALIAVFSMTAGSRSDALSLGVFLSLPYLGLFSLLAAPRRGAARRWGLELAPIGSLVGFLFFALVGTPVVFTGGLPLPIAVALGQFPLVQLGLGMGAARALRDSPRPTRHRALRLVLVLAISGYPILAMIVWPLIVGTDRHSNGRQARADVLSLLSAQAAHESTTGGWYGTLECLSRSPGWARSGGPGPEAAATAPRDCADSRFSFVDERMTRSVRSGYRFELHGVPAEGREGLLSRYAYTAVPVDTRNFPGWRRTGLLSFCGDSTGRICAIQDGRPPAVENGLCSLACTDLP